MKTKDIRISVMVMGILLSNPLLADTIPAEAIYMVGAGVFLFAVALAFSISFVFNKLLQYTRKEERAHIWFMAIGALVFPLIYMLLEEKFHFVGRLEFVFGYNGFALANILIIVALIFAGFHAGYFATVLKKEPEQRNSEQKRRGIKLQSIAWLIAITIFVLMAMKDQLREMKQANDLKKMTEKRTTAAIRHIIDLLNKEFDKVKWNEGSQTFSARTKEGLEVGLRYDQASDYYYLSFRVKEPPVISDTVAWLEKINIIKPLLSKLEYNDLMTTVSRHEIRVDQTEEQNYYDISFSTANLAIIHYRGTNRMEILWVAATLVNQVND